MESFSVPILLIGFTVRLHVMHAMHGIAEAILCLRPSVRDTRKLWQN